MPPLPPPISQPRGNAAHWRRFRRLMVWMFALALLVTGLAVLWLMRSGVTMHLHFLIAMGLGITLSLMLAAVLMGLVFVSARTGADDAVIDPPSGDVGEER